MIAHTVGHSGGFQKNAIDVTGLEKEQHESDEIYEKLRSLVGNDYYIDQYVLSPDEDRILYEEMHPEDQTSPGCFWYFRSAN